MRAQRDNHDARPHFLCGENVFHHAQSPTGAYLCCQTYDNRISAAIVDLGVGIRTRFSDTETLLDLVKKHGGQARAGHWLGLEKLAATLKSGERDFTLTILSNRRETVTPPAVEVRAFPPAATDQLRLRWNPFYSYLKAAGLYLYGCRIAPVSGYRS